MFFLIFRFYFILFNELLKKFLFSFFSVFLISIVCLQKFQISKSARIITIAIIINYYNCVPILLLVRCSVLLPLNFILFLIYK